MLLDRNVNLERKWCRPLSVPPTPFAPLSDGRANLLRQVNWLASGCQPEKLEATSFDHQSSLSQGPSDHAILDDVSVIILSTDTVLIYRN